MPSVYEIITDRMIQAIKAGTPPWKKPWTSTWAWQENVVSGKRYRGVNQLLLLLGPGYADHRWLTFNQCKNLGGSVKAGETSQIIVLWKPIERPTKTKKAAPKDDEDLEIEDDPDTETDEKKFRWILRYYRVFNVEQCTGLEDKIPPLVKKVATTTPIEAAEQIIKEMSQKPRIVEGLPYAGYSIHGDSIVMPARDDFVTMDEFYCTLFHELAHSTGHSSRLGRFDEKTTDMMFASQSYSKEELIAEFAAAFLCMSSGITNTLDNSAAYLANWAEKLKDDPKLLLSAASHAQKAADYILGKTDATKNSIQSITTTEDNGTVVVV